MDNREHLNPRAQAPTNPLEYEHIDGYRIVITGSEKDERGQWHTIYRRVDTDEYHTIRCMEFDRYFRKPIRRAVVVAPVVSNIVQSNLSL